MENGEVNNKHKDKYGKLKDILSIWSIKRNRFPYGRLIKHKYILCSHVGIRQWGVDYWETYAPVVNWISVRFLISIAIIHELPSIPIECIPALTKAELYVDIFMYIPLWMLVDGNMVEWVLKLNKPIYGINQ